MEDNAPAHIAHLTEQWRAMYGIQRMKWPAYSPDLNPIEHIWALIKHRLERKLGPGTTMEQAALLIRAEWDALTEEDLLAVLASMPARMAAVIAAQGGHTKY